MNERILRLRSSALATCYLCARSLPQPRRPHSLLADQSFQKLHHASSKGRGFHQKPCFDISILRSFGEVGRRHEQAALVGDNAFRVRNSPIRPVGQQGQWVVPDIRKRLAFGSVPMAEVIEKILDSLSLAA